MRTEGGRVMGRKGVTKGVKRAFVCVYLWRRGREREGESERIVCYFVVATMARQVGGQGEDR